MLFVISLCLSITRLASFSCAGTFLGPSVASILFVMLFCGRNHAWITVLAVSIRNKFVSNTAKKVSSDNIDNIYIRTPNKIKSIFLLDLNSMELRISRSSWWVCSRKWFELSSFVDLFPRSKNCLGLVSIHLSICKSKVASLSRLVRVWFWFFCKSKVASLSCLVRVWFWVFLLSHSLRKFCYFHTVCVSFVIFSLFVWVWCLI